MELHLDVVVRGLHEQARQGHHETESHRALRQSDRGALKRRIEIRHGRDVVVAPDGVVKIAKAIKASWAAKLEIATKQLYREAESMTWNA